jgi:hypothetical protein
METKSENEKRKKIVSFFGGSKFMFNQMDKFQCWVANMDVTWAKTIGLFGLMTLKLTPIRHPIVKEFL